MLQRMPRDAGRTLQWGDVRDAMPNQGGHVSGFHVHDSLGDIEDRTGVCALYVAVWCCLMERLPAAFLAEHFITPSVKITGAIEKLRDQTGKPVEWNALINYLGSERD